MPDIHTIGAALYGRHWQTDLAADLDVTARTVRRWAAGQPVPEGVMQEIAALAQRKASDLRDLSRQIMQHS